MTLQLEGGTQLDNQRQKLLFGSLLWGVVLVVLLCRVSDKKSVIEEDSNQLWLKIGS